MPAHVIARASGVGSDQGDAFNLFERAREALTSQLQLGPAVADVLAMPVPTMPPVATGKSAPLMVQLSMDDRTGRVVVRVIDPRTGAMLRAVPSTALAAVAAKIGRSVRSSTEDTRRR
jgi:hypothetical protein